MCVLICDIFFHLSFIYVYLFISLRFVIQRRTKMKWGPQAKLIDEALLKYYFVNISLLPRYIFIQHTKSSQNA